MKLQNDKYSISGQVLNSLNYTLMIEMTEVTTSNLARLPVPLPPVDTPPTAPFKLPVVSTSPPPPTPPTAPAHATLPLIPDCIEAETSANTSNLEREKGKMGNKC